ncbi:hypothetical protein Pla111_30870 [Botrimarina hoheduenensis]|uniref:Uncharacterized protein n=2 Tax=Botrimarina hoheduenensis TaxID=2528000 RepID=A0A5C5VTD6_9BACT|nr:hypothetical protein Pla111_30870 [Botrimarina hoheduenensis]
MASASDIRRALNAVFAYKAEWLKEDIFSYFLEPRYFPELATHYPCVLIGGRGTGKTTVLRGLSYQGQFALLGRDSSAVASWETYGVYHRIDTNRVTAFAGDEASSPQWQKLFAHYFNLLLTDLLLEFTSWYEKTTSITVTIDAKDCTRIASSLGLAESTELTALKESVQDAMVQFEVYVNNIADAGSVTLSSQGAPVDLLIRALTSSGALHGKTFSFLIDEYENLDVNQQQVVNTLIKHGSDRYVFKIGIRELCWKCKTTLNPEEPLVSPADYRLIDIAAELPQREFSDFAKQVCNSRLQRLSEYLDGDQPDVVTLFPGMSIKEEATALEVSKLAGPIREKLRSQLDAEEVKSLEVLDDFELFLIDYWTEGNSEDLVDVFRSAMGNPGSWETKCGNYAYAALFTIRRGRRGIRKYFCGWDTFTHLAGSNIRYLLELVDRSLISHLAEGNNLDTPVSPKLQTESAQHVGRKNLSELEGLSVYGGRLTRMLLGMGRVFGVMAADAGGHTPEVNQFTFSDAHLSADVSELMRAAVMHLACVRFSGTKPTGDDDIRDYDYSLHPVFAPFFVFSHRRKRKMTITGRELLALVNDPRSGVEELLSRSKRTLDDPLPDQMLLFEKFYDGVS